MINIDLNKKDRIGTFKTKALNIQCGFVAKGNDVTNRSAQTRPTQHAYEGYVEFSVASQASAGVIKLLERGALCDM